MNTKTFTSSFEVRLDTGPNVQDITGAVLKVVSAAGIADGQASVFIIGSTGSITTIEYEPGVVSDLEDAVNRLAPPGLDYAHEQAWHDGNGHSHVQAALIGPSIVLPVRNSRLRLGNWQQVVAVNHDIRPRKRTVEVTVIGTVP